MLFKCMLVCTLTLWSGNILQYAHTCTLTVHPTSPALSTSSMRPPNATKLAVYEWNEKVLRLQHQLGSTSVSAPLSSPLLPFPFPSSPPPLTPPLLTISSLPSEHIHNTYLVQLQQCSEATIQQCQQEMEKCKVRS